MAIDWDFIAQQEGAGLRDGYVPDADNSESGVTIGTGVDLGQRDAGSLAALGLSAALQARLSPYCGLKKQVAVDFLAANPLQISESECAELDGAVRKLHLGSLVKTYDGGHPPTPFDQLPDRAQTVIASVAFQYGHLPKACPHFWSTAIGQNWGAMIHELEHFNDKYGPRRLREANYLRPVLNG